MDKKITLIVGYTTITMLLPCTSIPLTLHLGHGLRPFPVFIECVLVDCNGKKHCFHDKLPVFSLDCNTEVPRVGKMRCRIIQEKQDTLIIGTLLPDGIESTNGECEFEVYKNQISEKY